MSFDNASATVNSTKAAQELASLLIADSAFFQATPLPDDQFHFVVRADRRDLLDRSLVAIGAK